MTTETMHDFDYVLSPAGTMRIVEPDSKRRVIRFEKP